MKKEPYFCELDFKISHEEILKAANKLKHGKAVGIDGISNEILKASCPFLIDWYHKLFNYILISGAYPTQWSKGMISSIYKSGNAHDPPRNMCQCSYGQDV